MSFLSRVFAAERTGSFLVLTMLMITIGDSKTNLIGNGRGWAPQSASTGVLLSGSLGA
jgi:hypothetical protein